ncbi:unnamed protein product [Sphagnum tenellum]
MTEMECGSITLKEKLAELEKSITILGQEKETAVHNMEKVQNLQVCETGLKDAENLTKELSLKNDTLIKLQQSYEDEVVEKNCVLEQVMKLEQTLEDTAVKSFNNEKQEGKQQELEEYVLKLEAGCTNKEEAASLAEKQVEKLQMQLSNAMDVEESLLSELDNAGMKIKIHNSEVDELQAQLDKVISEKKDLRL